MWTSNYDNELVTSVLGVLWQADMKERGTETTPLGYLHVDCDLYAGSKDIFDILDHKIVPGTVILFDELVNYKAYKEHEVRCCAIKLADLQLHAWPLCPHASYDVRDEALQMSGVNSAALSRLQPAT